MSARVGRFLGVGLAWVAAATGVHAGPLAEAVASARAGEWLAYRVARAPDAGYPCCYTDARRDASTCRLDEHGWTVSDGAKPGSDDGSLRVFVRRGPEGIDRIRAYGGSCAVDDAKVREIGTGSVAESVALLAAHVEQAASGRRGDSIGAIAMHDHPSADAVLERWLRGDDERARDAAFWLGEARGSRGLEALKVRLAAPGREGFRKHLVFSASLSDAAGAREFLHGLARSAAEPELRAEALFWIAQEGSAEAEGLIRQALEEDADPSVQRKAIFAASQLPAPRAMRILREWVESDRPRPLRREALFWLAQVDDDEVLAVFDELLREK